MTLDMIELGSFELTQEKMYATDPCYDEEFDMDVLNCRPGIWNALITKKDEGFWGTRVASLCVYHEDAKKYRRMFSDIYIKEEEDDNGETVLVYPTCFEDTGYGVGVDSGQAGFFDSVFFKDDSIIKDTDSLTKICGEPWYDKCCTLTLSKDHAGVLPYGVVSTSGYGDGGYNCLVAEEDGKVVAACIVFC